MLENLWTSKSRMLRPVRRCKSGCIATRVAPAFTMNGDKK